VAAKLGFILVRLAWRKCCLCEKSGGQSFLVMREKYENICAGCAINATTVVRRGAAARKL
jgi:hypothetical protein